jgi:hypothetical protein
MTNALVEHVSRSPLVQAAITEAVHRFYHDRILSTRQKDKQELVETQASNVLSTLWCLQPDWRRVIEQSVKRYHVGDKANDVYLINKPKSIVPLTVTITLGTINKEDK